MINSKEKGKRGEREVAKLGRQNGFMLSKRGQQYNGLEGEDVVGFPLLHIEVKLDENLVLFNAYLQACRDSRNGNAPVVFHRKKYEQWKVTMTADLFVLMLIAHSNQFKYFLDEIGYANIFLEQNTWLVTLVHTHFFPIYKSWLNSKGVGLDGQIIDEANAN